MISATIPTSLVSSSPTKLVTDLFNAEDEEKIDVVFSGVSCDETIKTNNFHVGIHDLPYKCELSMTGSHSDIIIDDLLTVQAQFDPKTGQSVQYSPKMENNEAELRK